MTAAIVPSLPAPFRRGRFRAVARLPSLDYGCVYVAELTNGVVKVGFSQNPRTRMESLAGEVRRRFRQDIARFHIERALPERRAYAVERELKRRMARMATTVAGYTEFFMGSRFSVAAQLARQLTEQEA